MLVRGLQEVVKAGPDPRRLLKLLLSAVPRVDLVLMGR